MALGPAINVSSSLPSRLLHGLSPAMSLTDAACARLILELVFTQNVMSDTAANAATTAEVVAQKDAVSPSQEFFHL